MAVKVALYKYFGLGKDLATLSMGLFALIAEMSNLRMDAWLVHCMGRLNV